MTETPPRPASDRAIGREAQAIGVDEDQRGVTTPGKPKPRVYSIADDAYPEGSAVIADDFNDGNPFNEKDWRVIWNAWAGFTLRIVLIAAAFFSVLQYLAAREETRVSRTLDLVELWERDDYQGAQAALRQRLADLNARYEALLGKNPSQSELAIFRERIGMEALKESGGSMPLHEFQRDFDRIVYFLNRLSFCVEEGLCSRRVADAYFRDYALSFWSYFAGYVEEQRKDGLTTFAMPIEQYLGEAARAGRTQD